MNDDDLAHLRRCVQLATEALEAGDEPFGSVLVAADGTVRTEDRNRVGGDQTRHPEFELARWAAANLDPAERAAATVDTSVSTARCAPPPTAGSAGAASSTWPPPSSWPRACQITGATADSAMIDTGSGASYRPSDGAPWG